jgi:hypothetical protein
MSDSIETIEIDTKFKIPIKRYNPAKNVKTRFKSRNFPSLKYGNFINCDPINDETP